MSNNIPTAFPKQEARLENWFKDGHMYWGNAYGHPKFKDGCFLHTSAIVKENLEAGVIETLHTYYKLGVQLI